MAGSNSIVRVALAAVVLLLPACGMPDGEFPSLERRPFETDAPVAEPAAPAPPAVLSTALANKVEALTNRHRSASADFNKALPAMRRTASAAAGRSPGSEAWVNAHLQLSRLDKTRSDSVAALSEIDELVAQQIDGDSAYVALLIAAQEPIAADVASQKAEIAQLSQLIGE